jgi:hypothetical protein
MVKGVLNNKIADSISRGGIGGKTEVKLKVQEMIASFALDPSDRYFH